MFSSPKSFIVLFVVVTSSDSAPDCVKGLCHNFQPGDLNPKNQCTGGLCVLNTRTGRYQSIVAHREEATNLIKSFINHSEQKREKNFTSWSDFDDVQYVPNLRVYDAIAKPKQVTTETPNQSDGITSTTPVSTTVHAASMSKDDHKQATTLDFNVRVQDAFHNLTPQYWPTIFNTIRSSFGSILSRSAIQKQLQSSEKTETTTKKPILTTSDHKFDTISANRPIFKTLDKTTILSPANVDDFFEAVPDISSDPSESHKMSTFNSNSMLFITNPPLQAPENRLRTRGNQIQQPVRKNLIDFWRHRNLDNLLTAKVRGNQGFVFKPPHLQQGNVKIVPGYFRDISDSHFVLAGNFDPPIKIVEKAPRSVEKTSKAVSIASHIPEFDKLASGVTTAIDLSPTPTFQSQTTPVTQATTAARAQTTSQDTKIKNTEKQRTSLLATSVLVSDTTTKGYTEIIRTDTLNKFTRSFEAHKDITTPLTLKPFIPFKGEEDGIVNLLRQFWIKRITMP